MAGTFKRFIKEGIQHGVRLGKNSDYRTYCHLLTLYEKIPRFLEKTLKAGPLKLTVPDVPSFLFTYNELFIDEIYKFTSTKEAPVIIDIGANIGLSILYFKKLYPKAQITGYEADPYIFNFLKKNLESNNATDVVLINKAVWTHNTQLNFFSEKADGGKIETNSVPSESTVEIEAIDIKEVLKNHVEIDFLKIDIEGAEHQVIPECSGLLVHVKYIFVEYHSLQGEKQNLNEILKVLKDSGFTVNIQSINPPKNPYTYEYESKTYNMQLNIFGRR